MLIKKRKQDYFPLDYIAPVTSDTFAYNLPHGRIRDVELITSGVTADGDGVYSVAEDTASINKIDPVELLPAAADNDLGYYVWGKTINFNPNIQNITTGNYLRVKMIQNLPPLFAGTMASATATTIVVAAAAPTYGEAAKSSNVYTGFGIKIYDGIGKGQEQTIMVDSYDGTNHTFTVPTWGTTPSGVVYYSLISPFPPDFEDALVMGAALRCKWKVEDANKELRTDYGISLANALDLITPRDSNNKRRLHRTEPFNSPGGKRIIVRRP